MLKSIEMTRKDMEEILSALPDSIKKKLERVLEHDCPSDGIHVVKGFVEQYEADNALDGIISFTCASVINGIASDARAMIKERKKAGDAGIDNTDVARIVIKVMENEISKIKDVLSDHGERGCCHH